MQKFRQMLDSPGVIELPGSHDVLSAMILEKVGFKCVFMSGYGVAASFLGNPDIGITSLKETVDIARNIIRAVNVPVVVDIDNGYGNENNALRMIHELEECGVAAVILEDQISPKQCGHTDTKKVIPLADYLLKLEWVLKARKTSLCVIARTDERNLDAAIHRAKCFHSAGADVTLIDGITSIENAARIVDEVPGHKQINLIFGGKTPLLSLKECEQLGFKIVLYSTSSLYTMAYSLFQRMKVLHDHHDLRAISDQSFNFSEFQQFIENSYWDRLNQNSKTKIKSYNDA